LNGRWADPLHKYLFIPFLYFVKNKEIAKKNLVVEMSSLDSFGNENK
jgi:hypothetical protein